MYSLNDFLNGYDIIDPGSYYAEIISVAKERNVHDGDKIIIDYIIRCLDGIYVNNYKEKITDTIAYEDAQDFELFMQEFEINDVFDLVGSTLIVDFSFVTGTNGKTKLGITHRNLVCGKDGVVIFE